MNINYGVRLEAGCARRRKLNRRAQPASKLLHPNANKLLHPNANRYKRTFVGFTHPRTAIVLDELGTYDPHWAIVKEEDGKLYLVHETKNTTNLLELEEKERQKILCGNAHFDELKVDYKVVKSASEV